MGDLILNQPQTDTEPHPAPNVELSVCDCEWIKLLDEQVNCMEVSATTMGMAVDGEWGCISHKKCQ